MPFASTFFDISGLFACFSLYVVKINRIMLNFSQDDRETKKFAKRWDDLHLKVPFYICVTPHTGANVEFLSKK